jgi:AraC family transcriptional regulator, regulatory protein of adaptative response / DNA-3-methyladenine glycosylase II
MVEQMLGLDLRALDRARVSRDPRFDGRFFIGVTSTGVYCRPICPARSPKRTHIRYFGTAAAAAAAGFRPCLRCRPEGAPGTPAWLGPSAVVRRALRLIEDGVLDREPVSALADRVGIGPRDLNRLFAQHVGASPIAVAQTRRLHFAKRLIDETALSMSDVAMAAGFGSLRRFNAIFEATYGRTPRELRRHRGRAHSSEAVLRLAYRPPYDWHHMRDFLARRAIPGVERIDSRGYARTVTTSDGAAVVCVNALQDENALELRVRGATPAALLHLSIAARRMFDLTADPLQIAAAFRRDPLLAPLVKRRPGLRIVGAWDPFECAVRAVLGQQVTVASGRTFAERLVHRIGRRIEIGVDGLTHLFPEPTAFVTANLDGLGLTTTRVEALRSLARAVMSGQLDFRAPVGQVTQTLVGLPGFGGWTAEYVALRALAEPDAFPTGDLVLRRAVATGDQTVTTRALDARTEMWRPWRGYAAFYLWSA